MRSDINENDIGSIGTLNVVRQTGLIARVDSLAPSEPNALVMFASHLAAYPTVVLTALGSCLRQELTFKICAFLFATVPVTAVDGLPPSKKASPTSKPSCQVKLPIVRATRSQSSSALDSI